MSCSNLANVASLLWHGYAALPEPSSAVNWAGFYVRDDLFPPTRSNSVSGDNKKLLLGPFQGKPACQEIKFGRGVCGTAALRKETVLVADVHEFPGHIACDADSRSEIVVPILFEGEVCVDSKLLYPYFMIDFQKQSLTVYDLDGCDHRH